MRWRRSRPGVAIAAVVLGPTLLVSGCAGSMVPEAYTIEYEPASVGAPDASGHPRVHVTEQAARRLGLQTAAVERGKGRRLVVPSAAVFVDPQGQWWVYVNPEPLVFVRHEIELDREDDQGRAFLSAGPPAGTKVVTVGVAELHGVEEEIGH